MPEGTKTTPAPDTVQQSAPSEAAPTTEAATPAQFDWSSVPADALRTMPADFAKRLRKEHPDAAQWWKSEVAREAKSEADRLSAAREAARVEDERRRLRKEDPERYAQQDEEREAATARMVAMQTEVTAEMMDIFEQLPDEAKAEIAGKQYPAGAKGIKAFVEDLRSLDRKYHTTAEAKKADEGGYKRGFDAGRKAALAEINGGEPSPDTGDGTAVPGKREYTTTEIDRMSLAEYRKHKDDIDKAAREGRIKTA